jgi:hypothetical protein
VLHIFVLFSRHFLSKALCAARTAGGRARRVMVGARRTRGLFVSDILGNWSFLAHSPHPLRHSGHCSIAPFPPAYEAGMHFASERKKMRLTARCAVA